MICELEVFALAYEKDLSVRLGKELRYLLVV